MVVSDQLLSQARERLYAAVISDVLDTLGHTNGAMRAGIRPLDENLVLCGRARTALYHEVYHVATGHNPYELEIALIDDLGPADIAILACGGSQRIAPWGELLSTVAVARGAMGCVTDGCVRDIKSIRAMSFPVFHGGIAPLDSRGRGEVAAIDTPVECGGAPIVTGDLVFGDADGVVVVPAHLAEETIDLALKKVDGEDRTREELARGDSLAEVFARHGVL
ncbi:MAG: RraA family protein [Rhodospirillales bacterium]|nr:RraA family protein [Rhodospirillales bacterium]